MAGTPPFAPELEKMAPEELRTAVLSLLPAGATRTERVAAIENALGTPMGRALRLQMASWVVDRLVPAERLVPDAYATWRPPVRDAMLFVVEHLSDARLAPKLLEQLELPPDTSAETRLLRLIAKVPGLQKLGQVLARNRHLRRALRNALSELENSIRDVEVAEIQKLVREQLGPAIDRYQVSMSASLLSEASVSAVLRFTWRDPQTDVRQRGVFKVLKPYIPACFAEDMSLLHELARFFGKRRREYGPGAKLIPDTFNKVRRLLQHEVNFSREQRTLIEAAAMYRNIRGVRVPQVIQALCTPTVTAISHETGTKVTDAAARMSPVRRVMVGRQLIEALVAVPLFAAGEKSLFHADPHAGNLLYDSRTSELVMIDWALTERLTSAQRRHLAVLFLTVALRDPVGASNAISALAEHRIRRGSPQARTIRERTTHFLDDLHLTSLPSAVDAMRLLEMVAFRGIRFPGPLIMLSKVLFTLDGILADIGGSSASMGSAFAGHVLRRWLTDRKGLAIPMRASDWLAVQCSALLYGSRIWVKGEKAVLDRLLPPAAAIPTTRSA